MPEQTNVVPIPVSEADRAADLKVRAAKALVEVTKIMDEGMRQGLIVRFATISMNGFGMHEVVDLNVSKRF